MFGTVCRFSGLSRLPILSRVQPDQYVRSMSTILLRPGTSTNNLTYNPYKDQELTLYVKGFMSKGENTEDFTPWVKTHDSLVERGVWEPGPAKGWSWHSGKVQYPYPIFTGLKFGASFWSKSKFMRITPLSMAVSTGIDIGIYATRLLYQYYYIQGDMDQLSTRLSNDLVRLSKKYGKVRVVAHSLGCRLLLNSLKKIPKDQTEHLPNCIHMCAPALLSDEMEYYMTNQMWKDSMNVYYAKNDYVLSIFYRMISGFVDDKEIVGVNGLSEGFLEDLNEKWGGIRQVDCTEFFGNYWFVHNNYKNCFDKLVESK